MILSCKNGKPFLKQPKKNVNNNNQNYQLIKILVVGGDGVGKTSLVSSTYQENVYLPTIGVDFKVINKELESGDKIKFQIWDTAGVKFQQITKSFYKVAQFILFVYDVTDYESFKRTQLIYHNMITQKLIPDNAKGIVIANKSDLQTKVNDPQEIQQFVEKIGQFKEISVKQTPNIIEQICGIAYETIKDQSMQSLLEISGYISAPTQAKPNNAVESPPQKQDYIIKFLIIGSQKSGKSSIMKQYVENQFSQNYIATIGVDFKIKTIQSNGLAVKQQIWDTAGQDRFKAIVRSYYKGAKAIFLVYDCQSKESFHSLNCTFKEMQGYHNDLSNTYICVVSNKNDEPMKRVIDSQQGQQFANKVDAHFAEVSAIDHESCNSLFENATDWLIKNNKLTDENKPKQ